MQARAMHNSDVLILKPLAPPHSNRESNTCAEPVDALEPVPSAIDLQLVRNLRAHNTVATVHPSPQLFSPATRTQVPPPEALAERYEAALFETQRFLHPLAQGQQQVYFADRLDSLCREHNVSIFEMLPLMRDMLDVHELTAKQRQGYSEKLRTQTLKVMLALYGLEQLRPIDVQIAAARQLNWARLIAFSGEAALMPLANAAATQSTLLAATQWCSIVALKQATEAKAAVWGLGKMKCYGLAGAAALGATVTATGATVLGYIALRQAYLAISAFRDVWDNGFSRDAYLFCNVYAQESRLRHDRQLTRAMLHWTPPSTRFAYWVRQQCQQWRTEDSLLPVHERPYLVEPKVHLNANEEES